MPTIDIQRVGATTVLTLNRPDQRNALDYAMREELARAVPELCDDTDVRAVVIIGAGKHFCSGGDVKILAEQQAGPRDVFEGRSRIQKMHRWFDQLIDMEKPVIAAVDGVAFGAGLSFALAADFVLATPEATFCSVFSRIGYVPDMAGMYLLPRAIGLARAKELVFSARVVDAKEALAIGLVHRLCEGDLREAALQLAESFHAAPAGAIGIAKSVMNRAFESDRQSVYAQEAMAQAMCRESGFHQEAVQRFVTKQPSLYPAPKEKK